MGITKINWIVTAPKNGNLLWSVNEMLEFSGISTSLGTVNCSSLKIAQEYLNRVMLAGDYVTYIMM